MLEAPAHGVDFVLREVDVLVAQGIDAEGGMRYSGWGSAWAKVGQGEHAGIVAAHVTAQVTPHGTKGPAGVDMAAPDPLAAAFREVSQQRGGLRIVDEHHVRLLQERTQLLGVVPVGLLVGLQPVGFQVHGVALQAVVHRLGALVEDRVSGDHLPSHVHTQVPGIRGTSLSRISATPPPTRVEFTCTTFMPRYCAASWLR
jgi:hypothetical protein